MASDYEQVYRYVHRDWSGGQNDKDDSTMLENNESQFLYNATLKYKHALFPREGCTPVYAAPFACAGIDGLGFYEHPDGTVYMLAAVGNTVYYDYIGNPVPEMLVLSSEFSSSHAWCFRQFMGEVYMVNGLDPLYKWDGDMLHGVTDYVLHSLETNQNRLWGVEASSIVSFSDILDGDTWQADNFFQFEPEEGDEVKEIRRFGDNILVFKENRKSLISGNSLDNFGTLNLEGTGVVGRDGLAMGNRFLYKVTVEGIDVYDFIEDVSITDKLKLTWEAVNKEMLYKSAAIMWGKDTLVSLPKNSSTYNNEVWVWEYDVKAQTGAWVLYPGLNISTWAVATKDGDRSLYAADSTQGQIYKFIDVDATTDDGITPIQFEWRSPDFIFGDSNRYKLYKNVYVELEGTALASTLYIRFYTDRTAYPTTGNLEMAVPAGAGVDRSLRLIPPMYNAVMGRSLGIYLKGSVGIKSVTIEYAFRGAVPPGEVI